MGRPSNVQVNNRSGRVAIWPAPGRLQPRPEPGACPFTPQQRHTSVSDCSQSSSAVRFERMRQFYRRIVQRCSIAVEKLVPRAKNERSVRDCAAIAH
jgi:hypothetical protein